jgi:ABC-type nitrate/sulfonate/bicarbonate transport system permease component
LQQSWLQLTVVLVLWCNRQQFLITDTVILGIIVIAIVAVSFELFLRWLQKQFSPWYGQQL